MFVDHDYYHNKIIIFYFTFNQRFVRGFKGVNLVYREENTAADGFAKWEHGLDTMIISQDVRDLPRSLQKILLFDRIGLPYHRQKWK